jgi:hypothetical protein
MNKLVIYVIVLLILSPTILQAQKQSNYWKLGRHAAVDFISGIGQVPLNDTCKVVFSHSSSTMCDNNGNLLFYSNGIEVYNRLDKIMPNGNNFNHGTISDGYIAQGYLPIWNGVTLSHLWAILINTTCFMKTLNLMNPMGGTIYLIDCNI